MPAYLAEYVRYKLLTWVLDTMLSKTSLHMRI
jgi:hypothetical protein